MKSLIKVFFITITITAVTGSAYSASQADNLAAIRAGFSDQAFLNRAANTNTGLGTVSKKSQVYTYENLNTVLSPVATKYYTKASVLRMVEIEYEQGTTKAAAQVFQFNYFSSALNIFLKGTGKDRKFRDEGQAAVKVEDNVGTSFVGPYYFRVTTNQAGLSDGEKVQILTKALRAFRNSFKKTGNGKFYFRTPPATNNGIMDMMAKSMTFKKAKVVSTKYLPAPLDSLTVRDGLTFKKFTKVGNNKGTMFIVHKWSYRKYPDKSRKVNTAEQKKVQAFVNKYNNRFRYYKLGSGVGWGIVGVYKKHILGIYSKTMTPAELKEQLEDFRVKLFFSGK